MSTRQMSTSRPSLTRRHSDVSHDSLMSALGGVSAVDSHLSSDVQQRQQTSNVAAAVSNYHASRVVVIIAILTITCTGCGKIKQPPKKTYISRERYNLNYSKICKFYCQGILLDILKVSFIYLVRDRSYRFLN